MIVMGLSLIIAFVILLAVGLIIRSRKDKLGEKAPLDADVWEEKKRKM